MTNFRRKRLQLLSKSAFTEILFYAIGEIFLVVFGILLVVQINNWYEAKKTRETEQVLLKEIVGEMIGNRDELLKAISYHKRSRDAVKKLTDIYNNDYREYKADELDSLFAEVQWAWTFDPRLGVLNSIKMTGQINTIQNQKLRSFITSFEEVANDSQEENMTIKSLILNQYIPIIDLYISANIRSKYLGLKVSGSKFQSNHDDLFKNRKAESIIGYIYFWRIDEEQEEVSVLSLLNESISIAEKEIQK